MTYNIFCLSHYHGVNRIINSGWWNIRTFLLRYQDENKIQYLYAIVER